MNRTVDDFLDFLKTTDPLENPNHAYTSQRMLAKRFLGEQGEDRFPRLLSRLTEMMNGPLVAMQGRKVALLPHGRATRQILKQLIALRNREPESDPVEVLTVGVSVSIFPRLTALLAVAFLREWAGLVRLRFVSIDPETIREQVATGEIAFAIDLQRNAADAEHLQGKGIAWSIRAHRDHPLAKKQRPLVADDMTDHCVVFPPGAVANPDVTKFVKVIPPANRIDAISCEMATCIAATGVAVALELDFASCPEPGDDLLCRLRIDGLDPEQLVLRLPSKQNQLSEPAKWLIEAIRTSVRDAAVPPSPLLNVQSAQTLPELPSLAEPLPA